jgi:hypothetical protein
MAKYRVLTTSFINNALVHEGTVVDFDGVPSSNLEPMDRPAETATEQSASANTDSAARMVAAAAGAGPDQVDLAAAASAAAAAAAAAFATSGLV